MTSTVSEDKIAKLPLWARGLIVRLQSARDTLEQELRQYQGAEGSRITRRQITSSGFDFVPIPDGLVRFQVSLTSHIDVRIHGDSLDINGSTPITIGPWATNRCTILVEDR